MEGESNGGRVGTGKKVATEIYEKRESPKGEQGSPRLENAISFAKNRATNRKLKIL